MSLTSYVWISSYECVLLLPPKQDIDPLDAVAPNGDVGDNPVPVKAPKCVVMKDDPDYSTFGLIMARSVISLM